MIGNDVVDLLTASQESNWRRKGFVQKVFLPEEQIYITSSQNQELTVWLFWSMKEAAYKAHQRKFNLPRRLNWQAHKCSIEKISEEKAVGIVSVGKEKYFTVSEISNDLVHTSAEEGLIPRGKKTVLTAPSEVAKCEILKKVSDHFSLPKHQLQLKKDSLGMPFITDKKGFFFNSFSFSDHGRFSAYILSLTNCEMAVKHS